MMGPRQVAQGGLFYEFSIEDRVPPDHLLRALDRFVDLGDMRRHLAPFYSSTGRPSIDPELMIRRLIVGCAFGAASDVQPKFTSFADPASQWTGARKGPAVFACSDNCLIDTDHGVILDVEASRAIRTAEVGATRTMIARTRDRFGLTPERLAADTAYGSGEMLGWLVGAGIEPHIPVIDKSERRDGTFSNAEVRCDPERDEYACPGGKVLKTYWRQMKRPRDRVGKDGFRKYFARKQDCSACALKPQRTPNQPARKISRHVHEAARHAARRIATTDAHVDASRRRKKVEMLFAHLKRILRVDRLRLRGPNGARDEFHLAATVQNLRKLAKLIPGSPVPA